MYCGKNKKCVNTVGGYKCKIVKCEEGFVLKNGNCNGKKAQFTFPSRKFGEI